MAIKKENKFDKAVAQLNEQETVEREKSAKVLKTLSSGHKTKTVVDKNGRVRTIKITEKRETLPIYIPETLMNNLMLLQPLMASQTTLLSLNSSGTML